MAEYDLTDPHELLDAIGSIAPMKPNPAAGVIVDGMFCVRCGGSRRMSIQSAFWARGGKANPAPTFKWGPALLSFVCVQCELFHDVLVHHGPDGPEVAVFSRARGGFTTPNTPENVAYYLDQAHRAEQVGATSAAAGMYRSALEMLLYEQGYEQGMLDKKIKDLVADDDPPVWRDRVEPDYLEYMKRIGNGAVHPNDGDVERQAVLDRDLLGMLRAVFEELLDVIYERPAQTEARMERLRAAGESFRGE